MRSSLRLRRPTDFVRVKRCGSVYRHSDLLISVCQNALSHNRYGIVTGKRLGMAVLRNKCRRRLRAVLAQVDPEMMQGYDIVVVARLHGVRKPFVVLQRIVCELLARAQLLGNC